MIRGSQKITAIFSDAPSERLSKPSYTLERDIALAHRFFYYFHLKATNYEIAITALEKEFYISPRTITDKLVEHQALLKDIHCNRPTKKQLLKRYPHFSWN